MSLKPETTFYRSIHKKLHPSIYREKMANQYSKGVPDVWYSGKETDLWVEYKISPNPLTYNQQKWIRGRIGEGRNVAVITKKADNLYFIHFKNDIFDFDPTKTCTSILEIVNWLEDQLL